MLISVLPVLISLEERERKIVDYVRAVILAKFQLANLINSEESRADDR